MKLRILSDLHTEICPYEVESLPEDSETVLILAGDCGLFKHVVYAEFVQELAGRFHIVLLVPGNHEFYSGKMHTEQDKFVARVDRPNVYVLQNDTIDIDQVLFVGATMWTSFRNGNPVLMLEAQNAMNDYRKIRVASNGYRRLRPLDVLAEHQKSYHFVLDTVVEETENYDKIIVVTHHAPSVESVHPDFRGDKLNDLYVNSFDYWIENNGPMLWIHGHVHNSMDYRIGNTRILCNPRGYARKYKDGVTRNENDLFDPTLLLDV